MEVVAVEVPGGLAQLGEHLLCKQGVIGSIPFTSTKYVLAVHVKDFVVRVHRRSPSGHRDRAHTIAL